MLQEHFCQDYLRLIFRSRYAVKIFFSLNIKFNYTIPRLLPPQKILFVAMHGYWLICSAASRPMRFWDMDQIEKFHWKSRATRFVGSNLKFENKIFGKKYEKKLIVAFSSTCDATLRLNIAASATTIHLLQQSTENNYLAWKYGFKVNLKQLGD